jgi:hypothetical protein
MPWLWFMLRADWLSPALYAAPSYWDIDGIKDRARPNPYRT